MKDEYDYDLATEFKDMHLRCPLSGNECDRNCAFLKERHLVVKAAVKTGYALDGRDKVMPTTANVLTELVCGYIPEGEGYEQVPSFRYYSLDFIKDGKLKDKYASSYWWLHIIDRKGLGKL